MNTDGPATEHPVSEPASTQTYISANEGPSVDQQPRYVAVRVGPQTTSDGCVRIDRTPRPTAHRAITSERNHP